MSDFEVTDHGSIALVAPRSDAAKTWTEANVALEDWQWHGDAFAVEPRMLPALLEGIESEGLTIE